MDLLLQIKIIYDLYMDTAHVSFGDKSVTMDVWCVVSGRVLLTVIIEAIHKQMLTHATCVWYYIVPPHTH